MAGCAKARKSMAHVPNAKGKGAHRANDTGASTREYSRLGERLFCMLDEDDMPGEVSRGWLYLVTGGAGFIGSHIAATLLEAGARVRILDNFSSGRRKNLAALSGQVEVIEGDLRDPAVVRTAMQGVTMVFHEAAAASVPQSMKDPATTLEVNVTGTHQVLLAARDAGVRRVVFASSCAVYGNPEILPVREDMLPAPLSPYAAHKLIGEDLCRVFTHAYGLETVALRYFNVYGPRQDPASDYAAVIPRFLAALLHGEAPMVYGDGEQTRDFIYVEDIVRANLLAATSPDAAGGIFNIGSGQRVSLNGLLRLINGLLGTSSIVPHREPERAGDVHDSLASIERAQQVLHYAPRISLRDGLARMMETMGASLQAS